MAQKQVFVTERLLLQPLDPQNAEDLLVIFSFDEVRSQMLVVPRTSQSWYSFDRLLYSFNPDFWGAGYCTEVLRWFLKQLFERQPERRTPVAGVHN
jgi:RimJ/RimL family protein N-acetyltransferase